MTHGYRLARMPGAGVSAPPLGSAPLLTRVSSLFSTGEPIRRGVHMAPVDIYTMAHMATGAVLGFGRAPWWAAVGISFGWGMTAFLVQKIWPAPVPATSVQNAAVDAAAMLLGWGMAKAWVEKKLDEGAAEEPEEEFVNVGGWRLGQ